MNKNFIYNIGFNSIMDSPNSLEELLIYGIGAIAVIPVSALAIYTIGASYCIVKSAAEMIFDNPDALYFRELYRKNMHQFLEPQDNSILDQD